MASASIGAQERMVSSLKRLLSGMSMVLVTTTSLKPAVERRSIAGPEKTACVQAR